MKKAFWWVFGAIILIIVAILILIPSKSNPLDDFSQCLTDKGAKMYGAYWCSHCQNQKKAFGSSWDKVNYIECATRGSNEQNEVCNAAGIEGYPTWVFADDKRVSGELSLQQLSSFTGCNLPAE